MLCGVDVLHRPCFQGDVVAHLTALQVLTIGMEGNAVAKLHRLPHSLQRLTVHGDPDWLVVTAEERARKAVPEVMVRI